MTTYLCFICHNAVSSDTNEEIREKYSDVVGLTLSLDSQLCYVCCHTLNKFWMFKSICSKRSLESLEFGEWSQDPILFREKGTSNLQRSDVELLVLCSQDLCNEYENISKNTRYFSIIKDEVTDKYNINYHEVEGNEFDSNNETEYEQTASKDTNYLYNIENTQTALSSVHSRYDDINDTSGDINDTLNDQNYNVTENNTNLEEGADIETIDDTCDTGNDSDKPLKKRSKKKKEFEKILLSLEEQKAQLERSRREKKYIEAEFKCYNCALGFLFKDTYQTHMMRHEESNGEYLCGTCSLRFASPSVLRAHAALHAQRYRCTRCGAALRPRARASHARDCFQKPVDVLACHLCGRVFKESSGLQQHLKRFHQKNTSRSYCSVCGKSCSSLAAVRTHMITHVHRKFVCEQCPATFSSPYTLTQHKKKHQLGQSGQHYCQTCSASFSSRKGLLAHYRNSAAHQNTLFECPICSRTCPTQRSLTSHIETVHSATKQYNCTRCASRFSTQRALNKHAKKHVARAEAAMAVCPLCGGCFKGNNKLNRHLREVCEKEKLEEELSAYYD